MNPTLLPPAMDKIVGQNGSLALARQLVKEKKDPEFKPVKLHKKN